MTMKVFMLLDVVCGLKLQPSASNNYNNFADNMENGVENNSADLSQSFLPRENESSMMTSARNLLWGLEDERYKKMRWVETPEEFCVDAKESRPRYVMTQEEDQPDGYGGRPWLEYRTCSIVVLFFVLLDLSLVAAHFIVGRNPIVTGVGIAAVILHGIGYFFFNWLLERRAM